ncbi:MAG TPA: 2-dehydro-3-deoxygalactonokinase [Xanthobacteraceae bacterium]|nr:2-dehydro-3-deoxygalactonokinase [Xanthobacteraceae bacterium]
MDRTPAYVAVDWGTSSFRLWTLAADGAVLGERRSHEGAVAAAGIGFEAVLEAHLAALGVPDGVPVMMCGMVGSRAGWVEAAYLDAPVRLERLAAQATSVPSTRRTVRILPGIAQRPPAAPDVMRGEETQLLGLEPGLRRACLPGTHSKWVGLADGEVTGFSTFATGELFQLLRGAPTLAPALAGAEAVDPQSAAFAGAVADALESPARFGNHVFALRAGWLLAGTPAADTLARLSGLLIGLELAGAAREGPLDGTALVASGPAAALYGRALDLSGARNVTLHDAERCVRRGLAAAAAAAFLHEGATR